MRFAGYLVGDATANVAAGAIVASLVTLAVGPDWPIWAAMLVGMFGGMMLGMAMGAGVSIALGAFEVMLPMMLTGMVAGMAPVMVGDLGAADAALTGAFLGLASVGFCYVMDGLLGGEASHG